MNLVSNSSGKQCQRRGGGGGLGRGGGGGPDNTPNVLVCRYAKSGCTAWPASVATLPDMALVAIACYGSCVLWQLRAMAVVCRKQYPSAVLLGYRKWVHGSAVLLGHTNWLYDTASRCCALRILSMGCVYV